MLRREAVAARLRRHERQLEQVHALAGADHVVGQTPLEAERAARRDVVAERARAGLAVRRAHQHRDARLLALCERRLRHLRDEAAVDQRLHRQFEPPHQREVAGDAVGGDRAQLRDGHVLAEAEVLGEPQAGGLRRAQVLDVADAAAAVDHGLVEQSVRRRNAHQEQAAGAASRRTGDGDVVRIAAERGDVVARPLQRRDHVEQAVVAERRVRRRARGQQRMREQAERPEAVVDRHHDDAAARQLRAVVARLRAGVLLEGAAMEPHQHRHRAAGRRLRGRPDVEEQAVLGLRVARVVDGVLRRRRAERDRLAHAGPRLRRLRRLPAQVADGRRCVRDAAEHVHVAGALADDLAGGQAHRRRALRVATDLGRRGRGAVRRCRRGRGGVGLRLRRRGRRWRLWRRRLARRRGARARREARRQEVEDRLPRSRFLGRFDVRLRPAQRPRRACRAAPIEPVRALLGGVDADVLTRRLHAPDHRFDQHVRHLVVAAAGDEQRRHGDRVAVRFDRVLAQERLRCGPGESAVGADHPHQLAEALEVGARRRRRLRHRRGRGVAAQVDQRIGHPRRACGDAAQFVAQRLGGDQREVAAVAAADDGDARGIGLGQRLGEADAGDDVVVLLAEQRAVAGAVADGEHGPRALVERLHRRRRRPRHGHRAQVGQVAVALPAVDRHHDRERPVARGQRQHVRDRAAVARRVRAFGDRAVADLLDRGRRRPRARLFAARAQFLAHGAALGVVDDAVAVGVELAQQRVVGRRLRRGRGRGRRRLCAAAGGDGEGKGERCQRGARVRPAHRRALAGVRHVAHGGSPAAARERRRMHTRGAARAAPPRLRCPPST